MRNKFFSKVFLHKKKKKYSTLLLDSDPSTPKNVYLDPQPYIPGFRIRIQIQEGKDDPQK
jgi:hypothetical protein